MEKSYTKKGINYKNSKGKVFFCPRENVLRFIENEKKHLEVVQRNLKRAEDDLKAIDTT